MVNRVLPDVPHVSDQGMYDWMQQVQLFLRNIETGTSGLSDELIASLAAGTTTGTIAGDSVTPNLTIPPAVENFTLLVGNTFLALTWDLPPTNAEVSYTEIARNTVDDLATAEYGRLSVGGFWYDTVGRGSPEYFYWARHVRDTGGVKVFGPWTTTSVSGQTFPELAELLALLQGELSELQLTATLQSRIDLVDAVGTGLVDRINTETNTRLTEIARVESEYAAADNALAAQVDALVLATGGRIFRQDEPPDPNTSPDAPFLGSDRWLDTNDNNHPHVWDDAIGNTATPPFNWVSIRDQEIQRNTALINAQQLALIDLDNNKAEATDVTTLSTTVGQNTATLQNQQNSIDGVLAEQFVRIDINGRVVGYGLTANPTSSAFLVAADKFVVGLPGQVDKPLFFVGELGGVPQILLNAQTLIGDASITNAAIDSLAAEKLFAISGTIAEAIIGSGHIQNAMIGQVIQSDNWNPLTKAGWRLLKSGLFEGRGITIYDNDGNPVFGTGTGFALNWARVGGDNRPEDNATLGAVWGETLNGAPFLQESFEQTQKWVQVSGDGSFEYRDVADAQFGGRALVATGLTHINYTETIPFDENATYRFTVRMRSVGANVNAFVGFFGLDFAKNERNRVGAISSVDQYHIVLNGVGVSTDGWTTYEGYLEGYAAVDGDLGAGTLETPARVHNTVRYLRPSLLLNFVPGSAGVTFVDRFVIDKTQTQITDQNISTFIKNAAIDTLYLAGSAVTVVAVATGPSINGSGSYAEAARVTVSLNVPAPVLVDWSFQQGFPTGQGDWGVRVRDETNNRFGIDRIVTAVNDFPSGKEVFYMQAGVHTFTLFWRGAPNVILAEGTITALAAKR